VRRVIGLLPVRQMASGIPAVIRHGSQAVIVVDVARSAGRHLAAVGHEGVRIQQREPERSVVELAVDPLSNGVALGASRGRCGEARLDVVRHIAAERRRAVPLRLVAAHAIGCVQCVIVVDVAGSAGRGRRRSVRASQSETGGAVVERSGVPTLRGMASRAIRRRKSRPRCRVDRGRRLLPSRQMASGVPALRRRNRQSVIVVDMARSAGHVGVPVGQQEARRAVIEDRRGPRNGVMASRAVGHPKSRARRGVHWISRLLPGRQVAARIPAVRLHNLKVIVAADVARSTGHVRMTIGQGEADRRCAMVEGCSIEGSPQPTVKGMARFAGSSKLRAGVVRISSLLIVLQVARSASR